MDWSNKTLILRVRFAYCGTGAYIFLNFSKSFISVYFVCYLFESSFNHGIWLGHCVPNSCRSLGSKKILTNRVISDTSEKISFKCEIMSWLRGWEGVPLNFCMSENQNVFFQNTWDFSIRELIKNRKNDDFYLKILSFDQYCRKNSPRDETPSGRHLRRWAASGGPLCGG